MRNIKKQEKLLEVLAHRQEEFKFNYRLNVDQINSQTLLISSFFIPLIIMGISLVIIGERLYGIILVVFSSIVFPSFIKLLTSKNRKEVKSLKKDYRNNAEKMKNIYKELKII